MKFEMISRTRRIALLIGVFVSLCLSLTEAKGATSKNPVVAALARVDLIGSVKDDFGIPIRGATLYIYTATPRKGVSTYCPSCYVDCGKQDATDAKGRFRIHHLDASLLFQILVIRDGYDPCVAYSVDPLKAHSDFRMHKTLQVSDRLHTILGRIVDPGGRPVIGAMLEPVVLRSPTGIYAGEVPGVDPILVSDGKGEFRLRCPDPADKITLLIKARGLAPRIAVDLSPDARTPQTILMDEGSVVLGSVVTSAGKPVADAVLDIMQTNLDVEKSYGKFEIATDSSGHYSLPNVPSGSEYTICVRMDSIGARNLGAAHQVFKIPSGASQMKMKPIVLLPVSPIEGQITLSDGTPISPGCRVLLERNQMWWDVQQVDLPSSGKFVLRNVPYGDDFDLSVSVPGYDASDPKPLLLRLSPSELPKFVHVVMTPHGQN